MKFRKFMITLLGISLLTAPVTTILAPVAAFASTTAQTIAIYTFDMDGITYVSLKDFFSETGLKGKTQNNGQFLFIFEGNQRIAKLKNGGGIAYGKTDKNKTSLYSAPVVIDDEWFVTIDALEAMGYVVRSLENGLLTLAAPKNAATNEPTTIDLTDLPDPEPTAVATPKLTAAPTVKPTIKPTIKPTPVPTAIPVVSSSKNGTLNRDAGKTLIGDSYYGWSMHYPSGLRKFRESFTQDSVIFEDATTGAHIQVISEPNEDNPTLRELSKSITDDFMDDGEVVVDKKVVQNKTISYAEVTTKMSDGSRYQYRAYPTTERIYFSILSVAKKEVVSSASKMRTLQSTFDSFQPSFNAQNSKLKDISTAKRGYRTFSEDRYGYKLNVPAGWEKEVQDNTINFSDDQVKLTLVTHSLQPGDTKEEYVSRTLDYFKKIFKSDYRTILLDEQEMHNGKMFAHRITKTDFISQKLILDTYTVFIGSYYHEFTFSYSEKADAEKVSKQISDVIASLTIGKPNKDLGFIPDDRDYILLDELKTIKNKAFKFSLTVPEILIESSNAEKGSYSFRIGVNNVSLHVMEEKEYQTIKMAMANSMDSVKKVVQDFQQLPEKTTSYNGQEALINEIRYTQKDIRNYNYNVTFKKNNFVYIIEYNTIEPLLTDWFLEQFESIVSQLKID